MNPTKIPHRRRPLRPNVASFLLLTSFLALCLAGAASGTGRPDRKGGRQVEDKIPAHPLVYLQNQGRDLPRGGEVLLETAMDFNPPVKITLVKSRIGIIEADKKLTAEEDWVKGLTVTVRNDSKKPITHISLHVRFPRPQEQKDVVDFVEALDYGASPIPSEGGHTLYNSAQAVMPGDSVELRLSDEDFAAVKTALRESNYPANLKRVRVSVALLGFDDDTLWMAGKMYRLDKENPGRLVPLQKKLKI